MTHLCICDLTTIGSDNELLPGRGQAIIWPNAGILLIRPLGTNCDEILIEINTFFIQEDPFENVVWKMASFLSQPQCVDDGNQWEGSMVVICPTLRGMFQILDDIILLLYNRKDQE